MSAQFKRRLRLTFYNGANPTEVPLVGDANLPGARAPLDLPDGYRVKFSVSSSDINVPNHARIKIYNLKRDGARVLTDKEYRRISLRAGYEGDSSKFGLVFDGDIKMCRYGREDVDTFVEIVAAQLEQQYNYAIMADVISADVADKNAAAVTKLQQAFGFAEGQLGYTQDLPVGAMSRGKVLFGLASVQGRQIAETNGMRFSLQSDGMYFIKNTGYVKRTESFAEASKKARRLNSATGLIGVPEVAIEGLKVRALISPDITIGSLLVINNKDIQGAFLNDTFLTIPGFLDDITNQLPKVPDGDGVYRVMAHDVLGDTRGNEWYSDLLCLSIGSDGEVAGGT